MGESADELSAAGLANIVAATVNDLIIAIDATAVATVQRVVNDDVDAIYRDADEHMRRLLRRACLLEPDEVMAARQRAAAVGPARFADPRCGRGGIGWWVRAVGGDRRLFAEGRSGVGRRIHVAEFVG